LLTLITYLVDTLTQELFGQNIVALKIVVNVYMETEVYKDMYMSEMSI